MGDNATHDPKALEVAQGVHQQEKAIATILFGSRAKGTQDELSSDIDILVITSCSAANGDWCSNSAWAGSLAAGIYGRPVDVHLVPTTLEEVDDTRHLADSTEGIALRDGIETIAKLRIPARSAPISPPLTDSEHWIPCCADLRELRLSALIAAVVAVSVAESGFGVRGRPGRENSSATDSGLPASVAKAMAGSRCSSASQQPDSIIVGDLLGRIKDLAEVAVPLVFPTMGDGHGFDHVGDGAPTLFGRLMQVALRQVLPALRREVARLIHVVCNCLSVGCCQRSSSCRGFVVGWDLSLGHEGVYVSYLTSQHVSRCQSCPLIT